MTLLICRLVEKSLGRFVDDRKANQLREKSLPLEGCALVAGRTDKGVTALQQVCSFCQFINSPPSPLLSFLSLKFIYRSWRQH